MSKETNLIVYHSRCSDGICSAAIVNYFLGDNCNKQFLPLAYGDGIDLSLIDKNTILWILDFSFPIEMMWDLNNQVKKIFWFDHHITHESSLKVFPERLNNIEMVLDCKKSGATITWDTLFNTESRPLIVNIVEDRDLWKFKLTFTKEYSEAIYYDIKDPRDSRWSILFAEDNTIATDIFEDWRIKGEILLKVKQDRINKIIKSGYYGTIKGCRAYYVNSSVDISEIGEEIYLSHADPIIAVIYSYTGTDTLRVSLRSNCINVCEIAKEFGGGGHMNAAGFTLSMMDPSYRKILQDIPERW